MRKRQRLCFGWYLFRWTHRPPCLSKGNHECRGLYRWHPWCLCGQYAGAIGDAFLLQDDNAKLRTVPIVDVYIQQETILRMEWLAQSLDLNPIEHLWDALWRRLAALYPLPHTFAELATVLQKQWLSLPMELINRIIESIIHRCMCCIASRGDYIPY